ncbi:AER110Wp [Eremothecium gossypii ATCC 10895]|uniref:AER110Wp n=1 Tax=Eremothecium gossypii (strain ATCC 10895 / CBS 109.51 / FGSC 9923 / NRRL Y-1056) TaxID=284811 RepID=Q757A3_EREGS|nr:AER110Wp [Eremothecium gossypii ATCC 10895]AAS52794.2 AER110Wp [Eremothecium gossypii ATCC 10895]AEY97100.1 FAER110Wp [Eremothecium gossypii FDAG1]
MYDAYRDRDHDMDETKPKLPQLPPLVTKAAAGIDHRTRIAWTPFDDHERPTGLGQGKGLGGARSRRPPPPPAEGLGVGVPAGHRLSGDGTRPGRTEEAHTPERGGTPEAEEGIIYPSPFVGDDTVTMVRGPRGSPTGRGSPTARGSPGRLPGSPVGRSSPMRRRSPSGPQVSPVGRGSPGGPRGSPARCAELPDVMFGDEEPALRPLPGLSAAREGIPPSVSTVGSRRDHKPGLHSAAPSSRARLLSDRTFSETLSSYYTCSSYTFNEYARHGSFGSVMGGQPLEHVPSVNAPTQPLSIELLSEEKLYQCYCVHKLSDIYEWLLKVYFEWFNEYILGKIEFIQLVQLLLEFQLPNTYEQEVIDKNVDHIIGSLVKQGAVRFEPNPQQTRGDITIIVAGLNVQGVFTELLSCYSLTHKKEMNTEEGYVCYSKLCASQMFNETRPLMRVSEVLSRPVGLWTEYWKLTDEELSEINPKEVKRQSYIFDLIVLEEKSLNLAHAAVEIYGAQFSPALLPTDENFASLAFDIFYPLIDLHKELLLTPIFGKLQTKGKFIDGVGKIYIKWCNEARATYLHYAESMAVVHEIISWEKQHETRFAAWLKEIDESPEITRSKLYHDVIFFGGFFKSLQNMPVTLRSILKCTDPSMDDYEYLNTAINEIEKLSTEVDTVHGMAVDQRKIVRFSRQILFSSSSATVGYVNINDEDKVIRQEKLNLKLTEKTRKLLREGVVYKKRELWLDPVPVYIVLLDNYFLITEIVTKGNEKKYKLTERPIPLDYLSLERKEDLKANSAEKEVTLMNVNSNNIDGLTAKSPSPNQLADPSNVPRHVYRTNASTMALDVPDDLIYSFKVRNTATNDSFTFHTFTVEERDAWISAIVESFRIHTETNDQRVFKLHVLSDLFKYDERQAPTNLLVAPEGSVIDVALKDYKKTQREKKTPVAADINCSGKFVYESKTFVICGSNHGIYMTIADNPTGWKLVLHVLKVVQVEVSLKLNLLFALSDKRLCYFSLPSLICAYYDPVQYLPNNQVVGVILQDKVTYFTMAEDFGNSRQLFFERKGKIVVLTPELDAITAAFKLFKPYKRYKLPLTSSFTSVEVYGIVVFRTSFIVCTSKGAILYNDTFNDHGITLPQLLNDPDLVQRLNHMQIANNPFKTTMEAAARHDSSKQKMAEYVKFDIAANKTRPVTCFQLSPNDFILVYDEAVIRMNKYGEIANWKADILVLDFYCTAACMTSEFLILTGENLVQIYDFNYTGNIMNNALSRLTPVQIIKGKKIRLLNASKTPDPVIALSHPSYPGRQLLLAFSLTR